MEITSIRIDSLNTDVLMGDETSKPSSLVATLSVTFDDCFVVHGVKLIRGRDGIIFLGMPDYDKSDRCPHCHARCSILRDVYCGKCGQQLPENRVDDVEPDLDGKRRFFTSVAHPVRNDFRIYLMEECQRAYQAAITEGRAAG